MNEELKGVAIDKLTSIEKSLGLKGENGGITFEDSTEYLSSQLELPITDIRPFEDLDDEQVINKLASLLKQRRNQEGVDATTQLHLFSIQYANILESRNFSTNEYKQILKIAEIPESLYVEIRKCVRIYKTTIETYQQSNKQRKIKKYSPLNYTPCKDKIKSYNRIIFGAPGTGKSFQLKDESQPINEPSPFENIERVTFHPDYSYGQFVGSYKPVSDDNGKINYEYVPGPFMRTLVAALESGKNGESAKKYLLIVEEINRAKVAAVFGDMFQLLDRTDAGDSVYEIQASEDVRRYLARELGGTKDNYASIKLPNNMYIWATMNSADQGVFPMDTAFKRRWEFTYLGINENEDEVKKTIKTLPVLHNGNEGIEWNILRRSINTMLLKECKVNEDKLLGPFFIFGDVFKNPSDKNAFFNAFNSKVLMYLFEDAGKMHQKKLFAGIDQSELTFSKVCEDFKARGTAIFGNSFQLVKE
ncbi:AAA family ATPase [uncultured Treponema sp.]|uniref:AAA family ATPase n=1 Tax=uncultured Treponema sp. TaxID=162155 RepID=UPI0027D9C8B5|nr:AAA family ATPase [uncultured Treponema sp.]